MRTSTNTLTFLLALTSANAFAPSSSIATNANLSRHHSMTTKSTSLWSTIAPQETDETLSPAPESKTYLDDGFVFGLEGSGLDRPKGKVAQVVVEGDSLEDSPAQIGFVSATLLSHAAFAALAISHQIELNGGNVALSAAQALATIVSSWVLADLGSGILHWSVDNYGNGKTPVMGGIIAAFQGHHSAPWTITERGFFNNVSKLCIPFGIPTVAMITFLAGPQNPLVSLFFTVFCSLEIGSQEFHKWSHMMPKQLNPFILGVQKAGLVIDRTPHAMHHIAPYEGNYCIVSGFCNSILDESGFFRRLERIVYDMNGVEANAWKIDPKLKAKTLRGEYSL